MFDAEELKKRHKGDISTLWDIYNSDKPYYDNLYFKISLVVALIALPVVYLIKANLVGLIFFVSELSISTIPTLLGFNLGAYILIVGFGSSDVLAVITKPLKSQKEYSFYQKLNGVLGFSVVFQVITLFLSFIIKIWKEIQCAHKLIFECLVFPTALNIITFFAIMLGVTYSLLVLISVVKHVFMFAQTIHLVIYKNELDKQSKKQNERGVASYCGQCGSKNAGGNKFCTNCGKPIT